MSEGGLRQRKRTAAMHRIQDAALDLFDEHGYAAVTIEQIAERTDTSPSSIYRYFGTKEQLVLWDEWDPLLSEGLLAALADHTAPLAAARTVARTLLTQAEGRDEEQDKRRVRHMMADPTLEAASARGVLDLSESIGETLAAGLGRPSADLEIQVFAHALVGGLLGAIHHWHGSGFAEPFLDVVLRAFDVLEHGLDLAGGQATASTPG